MMAKIQVNAGAPLRLVNGAVALRRHSAPVVVEAVSWKVRPTISPETSPAIAADDPRWLLARRVFEQLEGGNAAILPPESRSRLNELGKRFGLRLFDVSLVIAIVQDHAREPGGADRSNWETLLSRLTMIPHPARTGTQNTENAGSVWPWAVAATGLAIMLTIGGAAWIMQ